MKKIYTLLVFFLSFGALFQVKVQAQQPQLFGLLSQGGERNAGTILSVNLDGSSPEVVKNFEIGGENPEGTPVEIDGKLYGMTSNGGKFGDGIIYEKDLQTRDYKILHDFDATNGRNPEGSLVKASDGKLYGMTFGGGSNDRGVIFSFDPVSNSYDKLFDFDDANLRRPLGSLVEASDGKLYGTISSGGSNGAGVIYSFDPNSKIFSKLHDFDRANGTSPTGRLVEASDGELYGTTAFGGSNGAGVIFSFDPDSDGDKYKNLHNFDGSDGLNPTGSLVEAPDKKLYGTTSSGGSSDFGVIFSFDLVSDSFSKLYDFDFEAFPNGSMVEDSHKKLYGTTRAGGNNGKGVIFSFDPDSKSFSKLHNFDGSNGDRPNGGLMQASNGKFYGTTERGGSFREGVIFSFELTSESFSKIHDFGITNGSNPTGNLVKGAKGKLYGMTVNGGDYNRGVIFSFDPVSNSYDKLYDFFEDGFFPRGSLVEDAEGKLYGLTANGGSNNRGVIFSFDPASNSFIKLYDFDIVNGQSAIGGLVEASEGKFYGMTQSGGSFNDGVIFSFDPARESERDRYTKLYDFGGTNGERPLGSLVVASDGKLYGMTFSGGNFNDGVIFSFDPARESERDRYTKLYDFEGTNGRRPIGSLLEDVDGKLYGTTANGGSNDVGVIFSFDPASNSFNKLYDFVRDDGAFPGSLVQDSNGILYGATNNGGDNDLGVIFSFDPNNASYQVLLNLNENTGQNPAVGSKLLIYEDATSCSAPNLVAKNIEVALDENGLAAITAEQLLDEENSQIDCGYELENLSISQGEFGCEDVGEVTVTLSLVDNNGNQASTSATVTVENPAPEITAADILETPPVEPLLVNSTFSLSATITDINAVSAVWEWKNSTESFSESKEGKIEDGIASVSLGLANPGLYTITLKVTDICGEEGTYTYDGFVAVYDPSAGFVTGGGWIDAPSGSYTSDPGLGGKANFGFVSKYKKKANVPSGNLTFHFKPAKMKFKASSQKWLVISGDIAIFRGRGTIRGEQGMFDYLLVGKDQKPDAFRLMIWNEEEVIFDNKPGAAMTDIVATQLGGGSIVIHRKGKNARSLNNEKPLAESNPERSTEPDSFSFDYRSYPNPVLDAFNLHINSESDEEMSVRVYDMMGRLLHESQHQLGRGANHVILKTGRWKQQTGKLLLQMQSPSQGVRSINILKE